MPVQIQEMLAGRIRVNKPIIVELPLQSKGHSGAWKSAILIFEKLQKQHYDLKREGKTLDFPVLLVALVG